MEEKYSRRISKRVHYIVKKHGYDYFDRLLGNWAQEFSKDHNHGRYKPEIYMELQLRFLYCKVAREYRKEGGRLQELI